MNRKSESILPVIIFIILAALLVVAIIKSSLNVLDFISTKDSKSQTQYAVSENVTIEEDEIVSVSLIGINFWEARFKVKYRLKTGRSRGYLQVNAESWTPNAGVVTRPGVGSGVAVVNRKYGVANAYSDLFVTARMYDPYRNDHNYAEGKYPIRLDWPDSKSLLERQRNKNSEVSQVTVYRNVPNYIRFSEELSQQGFLPERINMMLAVCRKCKGSLIYGSGIEKGQLQSVLRLIKKYNFVIDDVAYLRGSQYSNNIHIGNTPPKNSRRLWNNVDRLISADIGDSEFFELLGKQKQH